MHSTRWNTSWALPALIRTLRLWTQQRRSNGSPLPIDVHCKNSLSIHLMGGSPPSTDSVTVAGQMGAMKTEMAALHTEMEVMGALVSRIWSSHTQGIRRRNYGGDCIL